jgi:N-acetylglucosamine-6-phosphate deacetylase
MLEPWLSCKAKEHIIRKRNLTHPGFIDLQVNGYAGIDFSDPRTSVDQILEAGEILRKRGTAGFLATITTHPREIMEACVQTIAKAIKKQGGRFPVLGIHVEGPFISPEHGYLGAHPAEFTSPPDVQWFGKLQRLAEGNLRMVTLAPERENAIDFIRIVAPDVIVSAGHMNCSFSQLRQAVIAGLTMATHIGNGCRQTIDRHDNPVVNLLACPEVTLCFIPDGIHLPEAFIRMVTNSRPIEKLVAVSDSVKFAGMAPGRYTTSSGVEILLSPEGRLSLASHSEIMAGSSSNMFECMNHLSSLQILSEEELWQVGYFNPLRILGVPPADLSKGRDKIGYDAGSRLFELLG